MTKKIANQEVAGNVETDEETETDLTVCDIIGEWGAYQLSVTLFGVLYSAIVSISVVVGPIWTPEMRHVCASTSESGNATGIPFDVVDFTKNPHQCNQVILGTGTLANLTSNQLVECERFIYDDQQYGQMLTNTFDLVCNRQWLRSSLSSAALLGMLLSSVTLGLLSDKYGRLCCIHVGFVISILATIGAILVKNYFLLNVFFMLLTLAQVGVANALSTLVMEATSPKYRFVSVFEYGFGWGLGLLLVPIFNSLTRNYRHFLIASLGWQLLMLIWCRLGVFESIRWLLSEGKINRAQIELQRACRINRVQNGAQLAQKIAAVQMDQVRKASRLIETKFGAQDEPISQVMRRSFLICNSDDAADSRSVCGGVQLSITEGLNNAEPEQDAKSRSGSVLSPTLAKKSFSISNQANSSPGQLEMIDLSANKDEQQQQQRNSETIQGHIQLVLQCSKTLQEQDEGTFFLAVMFHRKLYKTTIILAIISIMLETSYYGLIQATGFVGNDVDFNYAIGALSEWVAALFYVLTLWLLSRRAALIVPISISSLVCLGMALSYYLIPDSPDQLNKIISTAIDEASAHFNLINKTLTMDQSSVNQTHLPGDWATGNYQRLIDLREQINVGLLTFGKLTVTVAIQIAATISMESYPNNLRQSGAGAILFVGRTCSILAPFLFSGHSGEKLIFQITLTVLGVFGLLICLIVPLFLRETKDQELCDRLNDIGQNEKDKT